MNVYEKLMQVQSKLKAPKNQYNSFGKYNYRSCEDILEGLKPCLSEVKAIVTLSDNVEQIENRVYIKSTATFIDTEKAEKLEVSAYAREDENKKGMDLAQVTGSVSSYARKYALNGLFCIDDTKDSDATNDGKNNAPSKPQNKPQSKPTANPTPTPATNNNLITDAQQKRLFAIAGKENTELVKEILGAKGYISSNQIKKTDYEAICAEIEARKI